MRQVREDPVGMAKQRGYDIPQELAGDPRAMVMHLINSGQVAQPMLQRVMQMMRGMGMK